MLKKIGLSLESDLEIEKLHKLELQANKDGEFDILYHEAKGITDVKEEDTAEEDTETNSSDNDDSFSIATEGFLETTKEYTVEGIRYLAMLGITFTPSILDKIYKGILYLMIKLSKLLISGSLDLTKYIHRHINSFNNLKSDISDLRKTLLLLKDKKDIRSTSDLRYDNKDIINSLKIGNKVDKSSEFIDGVEVLTKFINNIINQLDNRVIKDLDVLPYIANLYKYNTVKPPLKLMSVSNLSSDHLLDSRNTNNLINRYINKHKLPGDIILVSNLPDKEFDDIEEVIKSYGDSNIYLTVDIDNFTPVESINYMTIDELLIYLDKLDKLCDVCLSHQINYRKIENRKHTLKYSLKMYFAAIINSDSKISIKDSFIQYYYLKYAFIDKVYLKASIDIHDYSIKIITNSLTLIKDTVKEY